MKGEPLDPSVRRWLKLCGGALLALAAVVFVGRFTGQIWLVTLKPDGAPMAFPTAVALFFAGAAMMLEGVGRPRLAQGAASVLLLLGAGTIILYLLARPLGWTRFIYHPLQPVVSHGVGFDGRMSPNAAVCAMLLGAGLLVVGAQPLRPRVAAAIVALLLAIPLLAGVSYLTGLRFSTGWWRYAAMAVHTTVAFFAAAAMLFFWLKRRMAAADGAVTRMLPYFVGAGTVVLVMAVVVLASNEQRVGATRAMSHALEMEASIDRFVTSVARLESATRAFLVTGDEDQLERIEIHRASSMAAAQNLAQLTRGEPEQHERALALAPLVARKFASNSAQVEARRRGGVEEAARELRREPPALMADLRAATGSLQAGEQAAIQRRHTETDEYETRLRWVLIAGALVTVGLIGAAFSLAERAHEDLRRANDLLEARVHERTASLEASAAALRESERSLRFLADTMPQLVWTALPGGKVESMNLGYRLYLGAPTEADAITALRGAVHPDDQPDAHREYQGMLQEGRSGSGELRLRRADGVYRWHLWRAHPERDANGTILRWVGTSTDIHDRKLAAEQLEQRVAERTAELASSEERFRHAFHFAGTGMAIIALDGRWLRVNRSICEIVGYSEAELLAKTFQDITHPEDLEGDLANVRALVAGALRYYQMEKRYFHRDGHIVWVRLTVSLVRGPDNAPLHFVSQLEDITERKRLEENLARARDQAIEASRLKSEFLATMSHEIRTPMNGVIGMTALLRDTPLTPVQADYVRTIESSGESLLTIINDILDYSKIEAGRIELEVAPFDLRQCVVDALGLFTGRALEKKIELIYALAADVPEQVAGDATRLRQILVNLLSNALKFTDRGQVVVSVNVEWSDLTSSRRRLKFAVRDTGIGIPPEGMDRLFKSFSQVDASTTRRFGGTGLGLAISRRLAELMGGTIWAESELGVGSTFFFTACVDAQNPTPPTSALAAGTTSSPAGSGNEAPLGDRCPLRLLIAEDNAVNLRVATLLLKRLGYRATAVANGLEALNAVETADYDAVLMDVEMPELDGCEATKRIREKTGSMTRPWIIALTAGAMQDDRERAFAAGMNDFLTKPVRTEALAAALARAHAGVSGANGTPHA